MWLDSRGRFFGKFNFLDLLGLLFLLSMSGVVAYAVGVSRYRALEIVCVEPQRIVAGPRQFVVVRGTGFDRFTTIWLGEYSKKNDSQEESALDIEINEEIAPGVYRLSLRDSHGRTATAPDSLEVVWEPKISGVKPKIIYSTGEAALLEISGSFFSPSCTIRLGELEVPEGRHILTLNRLLSLDLRKGPPPPLGQHRLMVTNAGGQSVTWGELVTVVPEPEVTSAAPDRIVLGETVDLILHGKHFREGTVIWLDGERLGEGTWVNSECLKIRLKTIPSMASKALDVFFELPNGPKTRVAKELVYVEPSHQVFMVAAVLLDDQSARAMPKLRDSLEWKLRRPPPPELQRKFSEERRKNYRQLRKHHSSKLRRNYNLGLPPVVIGDQEYISELIPVVDVLVPAQITAEEGTLIPSARNSLLRQGMPLWFNINGQELCGTVVSEPLVVFSDDYFENKRAK